MSHRIGIVAALAGELSPLVRGWSRLPNGAFAMERNGLTIVAVARGMGSARAEQAMAVAEAGGRLDALVSIGWAGGTSCGVQPGNAYEIGEVVDAVTGNRYVAAAAKSPVKLVTLDHVAGREEKRGLAETYGASLVDMEAATLARLAQERNIPFYCWKTVSDIASEDLPDFNRFLDDNKQLRTGQLAAYALTHPRYMAPLWRMGKNSRSGAEALAEALRRWIDKGSYADSHS